MYASTLLLASLTIASLVSAGPHDRAQNKVAQAHKRRVLVRRRHHAKRAGSGCDEDPAESSSTAAVTPASAAGASASASASSAVGGSLGVKLLAAQSKTTTTTTCTLGDWRCQGTALQECYNGGWNTVQNCTGENIVCSSDPSAVGCVWSWNVPSAVSSSTSTSLPSSSAVEAASVASTPAISSAGPSSTSTASAAGPSASASVSTSVIGANLVAGQTKSNVLNPALPSSSSLSSSHNSSSSLSSSSAKSASSSASASSSRNRHSSSSSASGSASAVKTTAAVSSSKSVSVSSTKSVSASASSYKSVSSTNSTKSASVSASSTNSTKSASVSASSTNSTKSVSASSTKSASVSVSASKTVSVSASASANASTNSTSSLSTWSAPHYVIYADNWLNTMPSVSSLASYNRFILAFWMSDVGPVDDAIAWAGFSASYRQQIIDEYHAAGIALMVSAFGSTDSPTTSGTDPTTVATNLALYVQAYGLDGVDIDYEDMTAMNGNKAEAWLITFQTELRKLLPEPYIISHAPVAPWFTSANDYASGAYVAIHAAVGSGIDFYNIQFYNQGDDQYTTCTTLITDSGNSWPSTSVFEINSYAGVPLNKIVIGKPLDSGAASNGYMSPSTLSICVAQAQSKGWNAGVMFWEWDASEAPSVMATVRG